MKLAPRQRGIRLPKQWMHWAKLMGLKTMSRGVRGMWRGYYLIGRGRCFRVSLHGEFEVSCPISEFDRWANSRLDALPTLPRTEAEFRKAVAKLLTLADHAEQELDELGDYLKLR